jgi:Fe-S cluster assembly protein SufD
VKCSHGSTTGQLDDEAVFYLRSRGLSEKTAKELLVKAFLGEVLEEVENEEVSSYVEAQIEQHFSA